MEAWSLFNKLQEDHVFPRGGSHIKVNVIFFIIFFVNQETQKTREDGQKKKENTKNTYKFMWFD